VRRSYSACISQEKLIHSEPLFHREHQEEDDKLNEKIHRDAVEGKMRIKRRGGINVDDDSDEDDDDEADKRRRRLMAKRRKIDGDSLDELGKSEC
jgi:mediator of replication checkpoint protein 1